ncbi:carboxypeptidase-like regulatory domain-containing protein [Flavisericum labens]|uniref:carboxypeptidase-like regulatory domain-containing protein n=1 Tax=Flavisericum labens TaxID=3377112 RepID=UPI00387B86AB
MNRLIFLLAVLISSSAISQTVNRITVSGQIIVEGSDLAGITVFNASSNTGTITDENGAFSLKVALNDQIEVSALQYQNFSFKINEDIIESKKMKLFLIEEINKLDEVIVLTKGLTGNLDTDMDRSKPFKPKLDALYFGVKHSAEYEFKKDYKTEAENVAMNTEGIEVVNGLNIVNVVDQLLLPLFRAKVKDKKKVQVPEVPIESIKYYFGSEFLTNNFNIPKHRVEDFIQFVQADGFDFSLLNYGKEMEFLELLHQRSQEFLKSKS